MSIPSLPKGVFRLGWWVAVPVGLLLVIGIALSFIEEPLRAYAERELNQRLPAYTFRIGALNLHPLSLSVDLEDMTVRQKDDPDPPIAALAQWHASLQWSALLRGGFYPVSTDR